MPASRTKSTDDDTANSEAALAVLGQVVETQSTHTTLLEEILTTLTEEAEPSDVALALRVLGEKVAAQTDAISSLNQTMAQLARALSDVPAGDTTGGSAPLP